MDARLTGPATSSIRTPRRLTAVIRWLARLVCRIFYRAEAAGYVPASGAVLLLPNHFNALLDPAIIWATAGRDIRFLAKSTLFDGPFGIVLNAAGAIPVYRKLDQGVDTSRNAETFSAVERALVDREAVCIFPEGISHSAFRLAPLRTGAARMALAAERQGAAVQLIAVGLNFDRKTAFRSRLTVLFGRPFTVRDLLSGSTDDADEVRLVTDRIADEMRRLVVEAELETDAAMVARVERLYSAARGRPDSPEERVARRQRIASGIERLREHDAARYAEIELRLRRYDQRLRRFGLRDRHLDWDLSTRTAVTFALREGLIAIVFLPVAAAGVIAFWIPYQVTGILARMTTNARDVIATAQVFVGAAVYAAWISLIVFLAWRYYGGQAAIIAAIGGPLLAVAGLVAFEREAAVINTAKSWLMLRRAKRHSREWLKNARADLAQVLEEVYTWLSAETRAPADGKTPN